MTLGNVPRYEDGSWALLQFNMKVPVELKKRLNTVLYARQHERIAATEGRYSYPEPKAEFMREALDAYLSYEENRLEQQIKELESMFKSKNQAKE